MLPVTFGESSHQSTKHHQIHLQPLLLRIHLRPGVDPSMAHQPNLPWRIPRNKIRVFLAGLIKGTPMVNKTFIRPYFYLISGAEGMLGDWGWLTSHDRDPWFTSFLTWILQSGVKFVPPKKHHKTGWPGGWDVIPLDGLDISYVYYMYNISYYIILYISYYVILYIYIIFIEPVGWCQFDFASKKMGKRCKTRISW